MAVKLLHWKIDIKSESEYKKKLEEGKVLTDEGEAVVEKEDSAVDREEDENNE